MQIREEDSSSSSSSSSSESSYSEDGQPGGRWGIAVAIGSFLCLALAYGNMNAAPVYIPYVEQTFRTTAHLAAFPGALMQGFSMCAGPFASLLTAKFGFRNVTIAGGVIGGIGYAAAYFSSNLLLLCLLQGIVGGTGCGLIIIPSTVVTNYYFSKRWRSLVTCICLCGYNVGSMIFPIVIKNLMDRASGIDYDSAVIGKSPIIKDLTKWRFFLIGQGGCLLLAGLVAIVYRPMKTETHEASPTPSVVEEEPKPVQLVAQKKRYSIDSDDSSDSADTIDAIRRASSDVMVAPQPPRVEPRAPVEPSGDTQREPHRRNSANDKHGCWGRCKRHRWVRAVSISLGVTFDKNLLKSPTFILITVSGCIKSLVVYVPNTFITRRMEMSGDEQWAIGSVLGMMGMAGMIGRLTCGVISSMEGVSTTVEQNVSITIAALVCFLTAALPEHVVNSLLFSLSYGFCQGMFNSLRTLMLLDLLGLDKLNCAFGLTSLFQGVPLMFGPTIAGYAAVGENSMDNLFYYTSSVLFISVFVSYPIPCVNRWEKEKEEERELQETNSLHQ